MERDRIDWVQTGIPRLFRKMFIPTLIGMLMASTITVADGVFVGRGVGSDALAAVNIVAPFFLITTGIGLMFGSGVSIVASIHLSQGRRKAADINITQAYLVSLLAMLLLAALVMASPETAARLMGGSDRLMPYVLDYMKWVIPAMPFAMLMSIGLFVVRLDGNPFYAMLCNALPAAVNVVLDYVFIFPLQMGIEGAALATALAELVGCLLIIVYMARYTRTLHLYPLKMSLTSLRLTLRNVGYHVRMGAPAMIGELAIACMMLTGNFAFMAYLGEDGVAAFSVACYCTPLVFMIGNAIAQSSQPILSFNYGAGLTERVRQTYRLSVVVALVCGLLMSVGGFFHGSLVVSLFLPGSDGAADLGHAGFPYFSLAFLCFSLNLVIIGYLQSLERFKAAAVFMLLRGLVLMVPCFVLLPMLMGERGLWLAIPLSELLTFLFLVRYVGSRHFSVGYAPLQS